MNEFVISFSAKEKELLKERDPILGAFMDRAGDISRKGTADPFAGLVRAIMGQQVSSAAHASIWAKFLNIFPNPSAIQISEAPDETFRVCGLSR
ncbi:MAG: DNA-3-methyladenine glycosylase 2 family protein, partial [Desulfovibrio sp.]|nr:DNA-3-methyladenine glycosylase 2 family protein [Desulfovibrio sp.]